MRKLLILLLVAAVIGIVISTRNRTGSDSVAGLSTGAAVPRSAVLSGSSGQLASPIESDKQGVAVPRPAREQLKPQGLQAAQEGPEPVILAAQTVAEQKGLMEPASTPTGPGHATSAALERAASLLKEGKSIEARAVLTGLYLEARGERARKLRHLLDSINKDLVFNPRCIEGAVIHVVAPGEVLERIGKKYGVNWRMIARINGMEPDALLRAGRKLKILTGRSSLVVYKSEFRLALLLDGAYVKEYPVGIGRDDRTPLGEFVVDSMLVQPPWYPPGGGVIRYGEEGYLLGERWIGFADEPGAAGLGVHGTIDQASIGTKCSNGCIRMLDEDVIELYGFTQIGTKALIRD